MIHPIRCRCCSALFVPDRLAGFPRWSRLNPRCRGLLPPTGGVPMQDVYFVPRHVLLGTA